MELLLDSGAYSAYTQNDEINIDGYIEFIKEHKHLLYAYINLDILGDGEGSYQNYKYMKSKGLNPIPVYHAETDIKYLKLYLKATDYISIGAIANMTTTRRLANLDHIWSNYLIDSNRMPLAKFHALGITSLPLMFRYPWYSVDSTSWVAFSRYGTILIPKMINRKYVYNKAPITVAITMRSKSNTKEFANINTMNNVIRSKIIEYIHSKGFRLGTSKFVGSKEVVVKSGLRNNYRLRDQFNFMFYVKVEQSLKSLRPLTLNISKQSTII